MRRASVLPTEALDTVLLAMIASHVGRACPSRRDIIGWTGILPRRRVWSYLRDMRARGLIEIEEDPQDGRRRRLRVTGGAWTGWTARHESHHRTEAA